MTLTGPSAEELRAELVEELARMETEPERQAFLNHNSTQLNSEVVQALAESVVRRVRVDTRQTMALAEAALAVGKRLNQPEDVALGYRAKANALYGVGDNRAAVEHHQQAFQLYSSANN